MSVILARKHFSLGFNVPIKGSSSPKEIWGLVLFSFWFFVFGRPSLRRVFFIFFIFFPTRVLMFTAYMLEAPFF